MSRGTLTVNVVVKAPDTRTSYGALSALWSKHDIPVTSIDCTQEEGTTIAAKFREANPNYRFRISWSGPVTL